jgi:hypothetical protein
VLPRLLVSLPDFHSNELALPPELPSGADDQD